MATVGIYNTKETWERHYRWTEAEGYQTRTILSCPFMMSEWESSDLWWASDKDDLDEEDELPPWTADAFVKAFQDESQYGPERHPSFKFLRCRIEHTIPDPAGSNATCECPSCRSARKCTCTGSYEFRNSHVCPVHDQGGKQ
jgi:hypothetical protein